MPTITDAPCAQQDRSDSPQYFIHLKNGCLRPVKVPPSTFAVKFHGRWCPVFRAATDAEFFAANPEAKFRLTLHRSPFFRPDYFTFTISTRDPKVYAIGDRWDFWDYSAKRYGTPREYWVSECERMLAHPHRCSNPERWVASQGR